MGDKFSTQSSSDATTHKRPRLGGTNDGSSTSLTSFEQRDDQRMRLYRSADAPQASTQQEPEITWSKKDYRENTKKRLQSLIDRRKGHIEDMDTALADIMKLMYRQFDRPDKDEDEYHDGHHDQDTIDKLKRDIEIVKEHYKKLFEQTENRHKGDEQRLMNQKDAQKRYIVTNREDEQQLMDQDGEQEQQIVIDRTISDHILTQYISEANSMIDQYMSNIQGADIAENQYANQELSADLVGNLHKLQKQYMKTMHENQNKILGDLNAKHTWDLTHTPDGAPIPKYEPGDPQAAQQQSVLSYRFRTKSNHSVDLMNMYEQQSLDAADLFDQHKRDIANMHNGW